METGRIVKKKEKIKRERDEEECLEILTLPPARRGKLDSLHPVITLVYFVGVALVTMFTLNPILIGLSFLGAVSCTGVLIGFRKLLKSLLASLPLLIVMALVNPLFVHKGETVLFFLNDNPVTLEAALYGLSAAFMLLSVFYWFKCYSILMTSDKFVYLFGRAAPQLSLILSMSLAFIPKLKRQYKRISGVQKAMGMYAGKSVTDRILSRFRVLSSLIGWALENSVDTADSMSARGYGLRGRTAYAIYRLTAADCLTLASVLAFLAATAVGLGLSAGVAFYPVLGVLDFSAMAVLSYAAFGILAFYGAFLEIRENVKWRYFVSKM